MPTVTPKSTTPLVWVQRLSMRALECTVNAGELARDAANRWLDNLEALRDWANKQFGGRETELDSFFEQVTGFPCTFRCDNHVDHAGWVLQRLGVHRLIID